MPQIEDVEEWTDDLVKKRALREKTKKKSPRETKKKEKKTSNDRGGQKVGWSRYPMLKKTE